MKYQCFQSTHNLILCAGLAKILTIVLSLKEK